MDILTIINFPAKITALFVASVFFFFFILLSIMWIIRGILRFFFKEKITSGHHKEKTFAGRFLTKPYTPQYDFFLWQITFAIKFFIFIVIISILRSLITDPPKLQSDISLIAIILGGLVTLILFFKTDFQSLKYKIFNFSFHIPESNKGLSLIGGYKNVKEQLRNAVATILSGSNIKPNGILLYGPPGCGKSFFAEKLAEEFGIKFIKIHLDEIKSMWVNEGVEKTAAIFRNAMDNAPCLLLFEEADEILVRRDDKARDSDDIKITNTFLTYMDDLRKYGAKVIVAATTNFYDKLDKASIRKGRFDFHIKINAPKKEDLKEIIPAMVKNLIKPDKSKFIKKEKIIKSLNKFLNVFAVFLMVVSAIIMCLYGFSYFTEMQTGFKKGVDKTSLGEIQIPFEKKLLETITFAMFLFSLWILSFKKKFFQNVLQNCFFKVEEKQNKEIQSHIKGVNIDELAEYFEGRATSEIKATLEQAILKGAFTTEGIIKTDKEVRKFLRTNVPTVSWDEVIVNEDTKNELFNVTKILGNYKTFKNTLLDPPKGAILYGPPGCGKTLIAKAIASNADCAFYHIKINELVSSYIGEGERKIAEIYSQARSSAPSIVFIDEADAIFTRRDSPDTRYTGLVNQILQEIEGFEEDFEPVFTIMATNYIENIDDAIKSRLSKHVFIPKPNKYSREKLFQVMFKKIKTEGEFNLARLADLTEGMSGRDIKNLINMASIMKTGQMLTEQDILNVIEAEKGKQKPTMENLYTWDDFIAPAEVKKQLYAIEKMFRDFEKARQLGLAKALNVMFYGPPGTGKTFAAKVLASQVNADFKAISSGELKQGIIGETERKIRELFEWLKSGSARILFIDEAESLFMSRQNSKHEYTLSVVNQFLSELQGFNETARGQYAVIISTNHPEMLDPAVLSRFSLKVHFELPGLEERKELFIKKLKGIKIKDINIDMLAKLTKGYSGRDIENMIQNAKRNAFIDDRDYLIKEDFEILRF